MSITLLHGSDAWRLRAAAAREANAWEATHGARALHLDGTADDTGTELERVLKYPSFFQQRTLVAVTDPLAATDLVALVEDSSGLADTDLLLVQGTAARPTAARKEELRKLARLADRTEAFEPLEGQRLASWVRDYCAERGCDIEPAAVAELTARAGSDSWALSGEMEKLCSFTAPTVTVSAVRTLVAAPTHQDEWELSNTISAHDRRGAVAALFRRVREGAPEQLLLGTVASAVRSLLMVRDLTDRNRPAAAIAKATGMHPYVVSKTLRGAAAADPKRLRRAHAALATLDRHAKDGRADTIDGLFAVLVSL